MRQFVTNHPLYKHDSVVSEEIAYDMLDRLVKVGMAIRIHSRSARERFVTPRCWETLT